ncbi:trehalose-phosphatase [Inquilinus sp. CAU 1745]|uniref:trehalose-phosphatase n=1 Tax=Inquilinus sp. CAU 1745 TaxID=3140369 RepID=UPI00325B7F7E
MSQAPADLATLPPPDRPIALFLDVDGTLIDIASHPEAVHVPETLPPLLRSLDARLDGAVALVSGRAIGDLDRLLAPARLTAGGQHGLEIRTPDGTIRHHEMDIEALDAIGSALRASAASLPGVRLEPKGMALAVHYRAAPELEAAVRRAIADALTGHETAFHVQEGKMVLEIKPIGVSKADVVDHLMVLPPFAGRFPIFIGDDATDEHGFAAARRLGGTSIQVGDRTPTVAAYRTPTVESLHGWLRALAESPITEAVR